MAARRMKNDAATLSSAGARARPFGSGRKIGLIGVAILVVLATVAILAPLIAPYDPNIRSGRPFEAPSDTHLLGTNDFGQDILSELIFGSRISLLVGLVAGIATVAIGMLVGLVSGYSRGWLGSAMMRLADAVLVLPFLPLMIVIAAFVGSSVANLVVIITLISWPQTARIVRSRVLILSDRGFVDAARALGASHTRLIGRYLLPLVLPLAISQFVIVAANTILIEASLSFLGLGDPTAETWGSMLFWAQARGAFLNDSWLWWVMPPGLAISLTVLGFTYAGYLLEDLVDPRLRRA